jgi:hypothetical protein
LLDLRVCLTWPLGRRWAFVEDDTMDRADPRQPGDGAPAPEPPTAGDSDRPTGTGHGGPPALPALEPPLRQRGRHEAPRRSLGGPATSAIAVVVAAVVLAGVLATWLIGSAEEAPDRPGTAAAPASSAGPTTLPGSGAYGNLVPNWSFEQDLSGWAVLGPADANLEPQGRTSGSCAAVRARGPEAARVGLAVAQVAPAAKPGQRYVASAWVRSSAAGQRVTVRLVGGGGKQASPATAATLPGLQWRRVIVDHTVAAAGPLRLEIIADGVPAGVTLLVDEVIVRLG